MDVISVSLRSQPVRYGEADEAEMEQELSCWPGCSASCNEVLKEVPLLLGQSCQKNVYCSDRCGEESVSGSEGNRDTRRGIVDQRGEQWVVAERSKRGIAAGVGYDVKETTKNRGSMKRKGRCRARRRDGRRTNLGMRGDYFRKEG